MLVLRRLLFGSSEIQFFLQLAQANGHSFTVNGKTVTVSLRELKKKLYLCLMSVNALEAIRFYVGLVWKSVV
ncbi:hypothetical protein G4A30_28650 [Escherichia coli]|nr:hypothetical protein [Escherichia coli]